MTDIDIKQKYEKCVNFIQEFILLHQKETFYAFAIDAGLLCMNSEEGAQKVLNQYIENWEKNSGTLLTFDSINSLEVESARFQYNSLVKHGRTKIQSFDQYLENYISAYNESIEMNIKNGNPYKTEKKRQSIRFQTGDWAYQGFNQMSLSLDESKEIVKLLNENKNVVFAKFKLTSDFKIFLAGHIY